jgi:SAM-dependent methyltransferase
MDVRGSAAEFYDLDPHAPNDLPFYMALLPSHELTILELGCGTGRILVPLASVCARIVGIDSSPAMIQICKKKLREAKVDTQRADIRAADIANFSLKEEFDLVIAPFRVLQNLSKVRQVVGMLKCVHRHLKADGRCILTAFRPYAEWPVIEKDWQSSAEALEWEVPYEGSTLRRYCQNYRLDRREHVLYPRLVYRLQRGGQQEEVAVLSIAMKCYYPEEMLELIEKNGFRIINSYGGYAGEAYGQGPELIVEFEKVHS